MSGTAGVRAQAWNADVPNAVGRIVGIDAEGRPLVAIPSRHDEPRVARTVIQINEDAAANLAALPPVAIVFEHGDVELPIVVGWVYDRLVAGDQEPSPPETALVDGERVVLRAKTEIELVCGGSSILMRKDGHIVIKGAQVVSRSTGANKIRGATVSIN